LEPEAEKEVLHCRQKIGADLSKYPRFIRVTGCTMMQQTAGMME
jgi:hypothetical protein